MADFSPRCALAAAWVSPATENTQAAMYTGIATSKITKKTSARIPLSSYRPIVSEPKKTAQIAAAGTPIATITPIGKGRLHGGPTAPRPPVPGRGFRPASKAVVFRSSSFSPAQSASQSCCYINTHPAAKKNTGDFQLGELASSPRYIFFRTSLMKPHMAAKSCVFAHEFTAHLSCIAAARPPRTAACG